MSSSTSTSTAAISSSNPIDCLSADGISALMDAVIRGDLELVKWMVGEGGASLHLRCVDGCTALDYARAFRPFDQALLSLLVNSASNSSSNSSSPSHQQPLPASPDQLDRIREKQNERDRKREEKKRERISLPPVSPTMVLSSTPPHGSTGGGSSSILLSTSPGVNQYISASLSQEGAYTLSMLTASESTLPGLFTPLKQFPSATAASSHHFDETSASASAPPPNVQNDSSCQLDNLPPQPPSAPAGHRSRSSSVVLKEYFAEPSALPDAFLQSPAPPLPPFPRPSQSHPTTPPRHHHHHHHADSIGPTPASAPRPSRGLGGLISHNDGVELFPHRSESPPLPLPVSHSAGSINVRTSQSLQGSPARGGVSILEAAVQSSSSKRATPTRMLSSGGMINPWKMGGLMRHSASSTPSKNKKLNNSSSSNTSSTSCTPIGSPLQSRENSFYMPPPSLAVLDAAAGASTTVPATTNRVNDVGAPPPARSRGLSDSATALASLHRGTSTTLPSPALHPISSYPSTTAAPLFIDLQQMPQSTSFSLLPIESNTDSNLEMEQAFLEAVNETPAKLRALQNGSAPYQQPRLSTVVNTASAGLTRQNSVKSSGFGGITSLLSSSHSFGPTSSHSTQAGTNSMGQELTTLHQQSNMYGSLKTTTPGIMDVQTPPSAPSSLSSTASSASSLSLSNPSSLTNTNQTLAAAVATAHPLSPTSPLSMYDLLRTQSETSAAMVSNFSPASHSMTSATSPLGLSLATPPLSNPSSQATTPSSAAAAAAAAAGNTAGGIAGASFGSKHARLLARTGSYGTFPRQARGSMIGVNNSATVLANTSQMNNQVSSPTASASPASLAASTTSTPTQPAVPAAASTRASISEPPSDIVTVGSLLDQILDAAPGLASPPSGTSFSINAGRSVDFSFRNAFFLLMPYFASGRDEIAVIARRLLDKLCESMDGVENIASGVSTDGQNAAANGSFTRWLATKLRILNTLRFWIKTYPQDFLELPAGGSTRNNNSESGNVRDLVLRELTTNFPPASWKLNPSCALTSPHMIGFSKLLQNIISILQVDLNTDGTSEGGSTTMISPPLPLRRALSNSQQPPSEPKGLTNLRVPVPLVQPATFVENESIESLAWMLHVWCLKRVEKMSLAPRILLKGKKAPKVSKQVQPSDASPSIPTPITEENDDSEEIGRAQMKQSNSASLWVCTAFLTAGLSPSQLATFHAQTLASSASTPNAPVIPPSSPLSFSTAPLIAARLFAFRKLFGCAVLLLRHWKNFHAAFEVLVGLAMQPSHRLFTKQIANGLQENDRRMVRKLLDELLSSAENYKNYRNCYAAANSNLESDDNDNSASVSVTATAPHIALSSLTWGDLDAPTRSASASISGTGHVAAIPPLNRTSKDDSTTTYHSSSNMNNGSSQQDDEHEQQVKLPYLGVLFKDLTALEEGQPALVYPPPPATTENAEATVLQTSVHVPKCRQLSNLLLSEAFLTQPLVFPNVASSPPTSLLNQAFNMGEGMAYTAWEESVLMKLSQTIQPRISANSTAAAVPEGSTLKRPISSIPLPISSTKTIPTNQNSNGGNGNGANYKTIAISVDGPTDAIPSPSTSSSSSSGSGSESTSFVSNARTVSSNSIASSSLSRPSTGSVSTSLVTPLSSISSNQVSVLAQTIEESTSIPPANLVPSSSVL